MSAPEAPSSLLQRMRAATLSALTPPHPRGRTSFRQTVTVAAPGRINLIGEHTDYNEGWVLPLAIDRWLVMSGRALGDREVRVTSLDRNQTAQFSLDALDPDRRDEVAPDWARYVAGVLWALRTEEVPLSGMEIAFTGNVPQGMGLSSSAALEVATGWMARHHFELNRLSKVDVALLSRKAENDFVGVACGIMDPFASALGREGHALLLDCRTRDYCWIPFPDTRAALVVVHGERGRELVDSGYNARRDECDRAAAFLRLMDPSLTTLRDASEAHVEWLDRQAARFSPHHERAVFARRVRHVVEENRRVLRAVTALEGADIQSLGELLNASHASLSELFEVSTPGSDLLVRQVQRAPGCVGARLVGGGFGGAVLALVESERISAFRQYAERIKGGQIVQCVAQDGAVTM